MRPGKWCSKAAGFSLVEMMVVVAIIGLLLAIAIPIIQTAHISAVETVVMREVQTVHQAQLQYQSQYGEFASSMTQLGPPENGVSGPQAAKLIPASLAGGERNGYRFTLTKTPGGFAVNANPLVFGKSGRRTFYIDEEGVVHQNWGAEPATAASPEIK